nr:hypothetical protein I308_02076 [Cryptococcus tetragattii IND107]
MPQVPKGYMLMQLEQLDPVEHLLLGEAGKAAQTFLTNLIPLTDDDYADAPGISSVDPVTEQLIQDGATTLAGSVPLIMVTCQVQANNDPATALVDSGAGINVIDQ